MQAVIAAWILSTNLMGTVSASEYNVVVLGVNPANTAAYDVSKAVYTCDHSRRIEWSKVLPTKSSQVCFESFLQVNDDFCDCDDSSDEPGTAACSDSQFYCPNEGHIPILLHSSTVGDSVCDCCDGSDEKPGLCDDTCSTKGKVPHNTQFAFQFRSSFVARARRSDAQNPNPFPGMASCPPGRSRAA